MNITPITSNAFCNSIEKALSHPVRLDNSLSRIQKTLNRLPNANIILSVQNNKISFITVVDGKRRYISKKNPLLYSLARRRYQSSLLEILKLTGSTRERDRARRARLIADMQHFIRTCERGNLDIAKIVLTGSQYKWFTGAFRQKQIDKAKATQTAGGLFVRSIAEREIINKYDEYAVPLHYEEQLVVNVQPLIDGLYGELIDSGFLGRGAGIERLYDYRGGRRAPRVAAPLVLILFNTYNSRGLLQGHNTKAGDPVISRLIIIKYHIGLLPYPYSFRSPSLTQPSLRTPAWKTRASTAGSMNEIIIRPVQSKAVMASLVPASISATQPV